MLAEGSSGQVATPKRGAARLATTLGMFGLPNLINVSKRGRRINSTGILANIDGLLKHEDELRNETEGERRRTHWISQRAGIV
jgi:hypothetical protein